MFNKHTSRPTRDHLDSSQDEALNQERKLREALNRERNPGEAFNKERNPEEAITRERGTSKLVGGSQIITR